MYNSRLEYDAEQIKENERVIETINNKIFLRREDPFGLWKLYIEKGTLPDRLKGTYTTAREAARDARIYLNNSRWLRHKITKDTDV